MEELFLMHKATRDNLLKTSEGLDTAQLNHIPDGFNNNIIWNLGHVVVTQQLLVYKLSGNEVRIDKSLIEKFRKGSKPEGDLTAEEIHTIKDLLSKTHTQAIEDYQAGMFAKYTPYQTSYGYKINSVLDALAFNNIHESMHLGNIISMKKLV